METPVHRVTARNTATGSPNKIHDSEVARTYGFAGGLVPGVTIFAWMCRPAVDAFGEEWLRRGSISARFLRPIYERDEIEVSGGIASDGSLELSVRGGDDPRATGRAAVAPHPVTARDAGVFARASLPADPPPANAVSLAPGRILGTIDVPFGVDRVGHYLRSIDAEIPLCAELRVAHPGWLLLLANLALSSNVALGPWIHTSSDLTLLDTVKDEEPVAALSRVADRYDRKGHSFVELDILITASERPVASVRHVAIYEPRRP